MSILLIATATGLLAFNGDQPSDAAFPGRHISALACHADASCLAVVDHLELWHRTQTGVWSHLSTAPIPLQSIVSANGTIFAGGLEEATMLRLNIQRVFERLESFDHVAGRETWFAGGPPLGVRSLAAPTGPSALLAAVHVGGIPRSTDHGETWTPTIPVVYDVHEVCTHPSLPAFVAAATTVGLCISRDAGLHWTVYAEGLTITNSLAVTVLEEEVLFSIQDGPFPKQSQLWRWHIATSKLEPVRDGLPEFLEGKIDTAWLTSAHGHAALKDGAGNLWLSTQGSRAWRKIAQLDVYAPAMLML